MRNIFEAKIKFVNGKSLSFSGKSGANLPLSQYNFISTNTLFVSMVAILPLLYITTYSTITDFNAANQSSCAIIQRLFPAGFYAPENSGIISQSFIFKNSTSV